jgi:hypothetical protein
MKDERAEMKRATKMPDDPHGDQSVNPSHPSSYDEKVRVEDE